MNPHYLYLTVDLAVLAIPLALSFDRKVKFARFWPALFPAIAVMMALFIPWDIAFTESNIWGFNEAYLSGFWIAGIPLEEWLFFICIPYACVFTYESLKYYVPRPPLKPLALPLTLLLAVAAASLALVYPERRYIATTSALTAAFCVALALAAAIKPVVRTWNHGLWFAYLPLLVPFILSNGVLTGLDFWQYDVLNLDVQGISDQIVWYNNDHNLSVRIFSMPLDDLIYGFLMIAMTIISYEVIAKKIGLVTGEPPAVRP
ncbi:lycopene cyclase domain-containing protein [Flavobacteriales bacterium]|nr:lycopene cyclase domain-containing protein [Flavobacteriales bacterium]